MTTLPYGLGRRKRAIAKVRLLPNKQEEMTINGKALFEYFETEAMSKMATRALRLTSQDEKFGFEAKVYGGGKLGQAGAVQLGIARALLEVDEGFKKQLKDAGLLTRDAREKERKKPGLRRARRARQFSKR